MTSAYRLPVGGLVAKSLGIYFGNLLPFTLLAVLVYAPWIAVRFAFESSPTQALLWSGTILQQLGGQVLAGALTYGVVQKLRGQPAAIGDVVVVGVRSFLRVLLVGIVYGLLVGCGTLLLIVPGMILLTVYYVALPAAVLESKGVGGAMQRSSGLTRGNRWPIFGAVVLFTIVMIGVGMLLGLATVTTTDEVPPMWLEVAFTVLLAPFGATMPAVCYFMLRTGKENTDCQKTEAVFD